MRQPLWGDPRLEYQDGALHALEVDGRVLLVGMYYRSEYGDHRIDLRDGMTGELVDLYDRCLVWKVSWVPPSTYFWRHENYIVFRAGGWCFSEAVRVTRNGFEYLFAPEVFVGIPVVVDGELELVEPDARTMSFHKWLNENESADRTWTAPDGWSDPEPISIRGRLYAWLDYDVPDDVPTEDKWRVSAEHGRLLWDVGADRPVGNPLLVRGYTRGPWELDGRPVALFEVDWRYPQVWDLGRQEPLGPRIADYKPQCPSVGMVHGRPALVDTMGKSLRIWDLRTGRLLSHDDLPEEPIATVIGPANTVWAICRNGYVGTVKTPIDRIHPLKNVN